ncbi:MAG TPA: S-layer homology domain-containing protein [Clostridia bacterium]|nr:S-layer homology domain-containing protein [Clostridia bacterium]
MKRNGTRYFLLFLALAIILNVCLPLLADAGEDTYGEEAPLLDKQTAKNELLYIEDSSYDFKDISKYWAREDILELSYMGILKGYDDGTVKPDRTISREEFVAMLVRALGIETEDTFEKTYSDVTDKHWSHKYITAAKENGLLTIFSGYYFYPYKEITREEMAVITSKAVQNAKITGEERSFKDIPQYYRYEEDIKRVTALGIITGLPDGSFNPKGNATRAQAAAVIGRMLGTVEASRVPADSKLTSIAEEYETDMLSSISGGDLGLSGPLLLSTGREATLNSQRAEKLKTQYQQGLVSGKHMGDRSFTVLSKSSYLAQVEASYELVPEDGGFTYTVDKTFYLIRTGTDWAVYNTEYRFGEDSAEGGKINLTWNYIWDKNTDNANIKKVAGLNVISPTWFTLASESGAAEDRGNLNYSNWAHKNGYKVWALVDNKFDSALTNGFLNNKSARTAFIDSLIGYAKKYKLDGLNIDFENMYTKDKNAFTQFMTELYQKTKANGLVLSVDVSVIAVNSNWSESFDRAALSKVVDYVALMTYDQHWGGSPVSGSVAQLSWVEQNLKKVLKEVPGEKLLLGVPFYTRLWKEETVNGSISVTSKAISMEEAERTIAENNASKTWDAESGQYYATYKKGNATYRIWLEEERSIKLKAELVNKYGLAGIASWKYGLEKPGVWTAIAQTLGSGSTN